MCTGTNRKPLPVCDGGTVLLSMQAKILFPSLALDFHQSCLRRRMVRHGFVGGGAEGVGLLLFLFLF